MTEENDQQVTEDEGVSAPKEEEEGVSVASTEDTDETEAQESSTEDEQDNEEGVEVTFKEEFGDSIERLFKKCLWEVIPDEYFQEDRNRPKPEYRDAYYGAVDAEVDELVEIFETRSKAVIERLENAEQAVVIKEKVEEALASGDLDLINKLAEQVDQHNATRNPADIY